VCANVTNSIWDIDLAYTDQPLSVFHLFDNPPLPNQQFSYNPATKAIFSAFSGGGCLTYSTTDQQVRLATCSPNNLLQMWTLILVVWWILFEGNDDARNSHIISKMNIYEIFKHCLFFVVNRPFWGTSKFKTESVMKQS